MKRSSLHDIANIVLYVILFLLIQLAVTFAVAIIAMWIGGTPWSSISQHLQTGSLGLNGKELVAATAISSVLTFCLSSPATGLLSSATGWPHVLGQL